MKPQHLLLVLSAVCTSACADEDISEVDGRISAKIAVVRGATPRSFNSDVAPKE
ncbi:hypothetical protein VB151_01420 [Xanthomonas fragariae]|uniref:Uncharacterized protein n=1 Tax=Xanthomonas fragariae TaxID=48664 RepID=A0A1Y6GT21_9XANT|nr:hypothetical protein [Xanthomonas fragariae]ENZ96719.1 hypothetical protein O1K_03361 [Xanthomonas fragariae LMG 25863]MBL9198410.1 hypothetical protein [Xanthomonas fragariae]MBL9221857.1 hypothetical protein [Xanthomonas fragariae]MDM7554459.1 hypothetical protein [Xanthomonas fragariae]MDM7557602.1 hypothetical protein [Xanthomonas fragariae]